MPIPRFQLSTALCVVAAICLWFATISMGDFGFNVRFIFMMFLWAYPIWGVAYRRGRERCFWVGFLTMGAIQAASYFDPVHMVFGSGNRLVLPWTNLFAVSICDGLSLPYDGAYRSWLMSTCWLIGNLSVCLVGGCLCWAFCRERVSAPPSGGGVV